MSNLAGIYNQEVASSAPSYAPMPNGVYTVVITDEEIKQTKKGTGQYLSLTMEVLEGQFTKRKIFDNINLVNESQTAMAIGQRAFANILNQIGLDPNTIQDSSEMVMKPFKVLVEQEVKTDRTGKPVLDAMGNPEMRNVVARDGYDAEKMGGATATTQETPSQSNTTEDAPW